VERQRRSADRSHGNARVSNARALAAAVQRWYEGDMTRFAILLSVVLAASCSKSTIEPSPKPPRTSCKQTAAQLGAWIRALADQHPRLSVKAFANTDPPPPPPPPLPSKAKRKTGSHGRR